VPVESVSGERPLPTLTPLPAAGLLAYQMDSQASSTFDSEHRLACNPLVQSVLALSPSSNSNVAA